MPIWLFDFKFYQGKNDAAAISSNVKCTGKIQMFDDCHLSGRLQRGHEGRFLKPYHLIQITESHQSSLLNGSQLVSQLVRVKVGSGPIRIKWHCIIVCLSQVIPICTPARSKCSKGVMVTFKTANGCQVIIPNHQTSNNVVNKATL